MVIPKTYGRMGNFLFQAACAIAYAHNHGLEFTVPTTTNDPKWNPIYLQHLARPDFNPKLESILIQEKRSTYQQLPFEESWRAKNIVLDGYWQTEKYFAHIRPRILELFKIPWNPVRNFVSVHVRRGDYLTIRKGAMLKHPPVPKGWIEQQMDRMNKGKRYGFMFFSDDIAWCRQEFGQREDCAFASGYSELSDLGEMSCCEHHICSASTFSWWGAWLNQNPKKRVIMPKHWLTPGWSSFDASDIVPKGWERY